MGTGSETQLVSWILCVPQTQGQLFWEYSGNAQMFLLRATFIGFQHRKDNCAERGYG